MRPGYSQDELIAAIRQSTTIAEALRRLHLAPVGGNYKTIHTAVKRLRLDTSHWLGQRHLLGKRHPWPKPIPLSRILTRNSTFKTSYLKTRLLLTGRLKNECATCGLTEWLGKPISLHLDHRNGIRDDNRLSNLCLLCPNCHSQTETHCGKNNRRK